MPCLTFNEWVTIEEEVDATTATGRSRTWVTREERWARVAAVDVVARSVLQQEAVETPTTANYANVTHSIMFRDDLTALLGTLRFVWKNRILLPVHRPFTREVQSNVMTVYYAQEQIAQVDDEVPEEDSGYGSGSGVGGLS